MKKLLVASLSFCCAALCAESLVAHWDFSKNVNAVKGSFAMRIRGKSAIAQEGKSAFLRINAEKGKEAGVITRNVYKELSPAAFRAEITFRMGKGKAVSSHQFLLDSKYISYVHKAPAQNKGFILYLIQSGAKFIPCAAVGLGTRSLFFRGTAFDLPAGKKCTLSFSWNGKDTAEFKVDNVVNAVQKVAKGGPMVSAHYPLSIGDRYSGTYFPFNGDIFEVRIFDLSAKGK